MGEPTNVDIDEFVRRHNNDIVATLNAASDKHMYVSLQLLRDYISYSILYFSVCIYCYYIFLLNYF